MKKMFFLVCFLTVAYSFSIAQDYSYGFTGGAVFANIRTKVPGHAEHSDSKVGFTVGAFYEYAYNAHFSFQPAINFVQKGGKGENDNFTYDYRLNYIEVPLNFLYYFKTKGPKFFVGLGPWFSAGISGEAKTDDGVSDTTYTIKFGSNDVKDDLKTFDLGANALVGCKLQNGFLISAGYSAGLHSINFHNEKLMNYYYSIKLGYTLASKKVKK
jgi:hypothetical protein